VIGTTSHETNIATGGQLAVLIVDDSEDDALLVARELRRSGFALETRRVDTAEAMSAALAERRWDLILADYRMPHFSGPLALELFQKSGLDIPFILVSGTVGEEVAAALMKAGADDFVLKQHVARLAAAVERELRDAEVRRKRRWAEAALEILADTGKLAIEATDFDTVIHRAAALPVPRLADWCVIYSTDKVACCDAMAYAGAAGVDSAALEELAAHYQPTFAPDDAFYGDALRSRRPTLLHAIDGPDLARFVRDARQAELLRSLEARSLMIIPQVTRDKLVGILVLASRQAERYSVADLGIANEIGGRIALVVANARLARAREEFMSTAIHEIKTPISVIKTAVQLAQRLPPERYADRLPDLFARLDRQCNRLIRLVTEVLEVSRLDLKRMTLARRPTNLGELVGRIVDEMRGVSSRHTLVIRRADAIVISVDPDRIEQVLTNLLANAIKYAPNGGPIEIVSRLEPDAAVVSVSDHGIGIPREKQARIFERFYRAHTGTAYEHSSSLGVGLYLSREFVLRHGGKMWFESEEGVGSTFSFSLPLSSGAS
jgi:signal transduction histidine kinase/FixJ family two-component response regulator